MRTKARNRQANPIRSVSAPSALAILDKVVDGCLLSCLFIAPLWFGGRHDLGKLIYAVLVGVATIAWLGRSLLTRETTFQLTKAHLLLVLAVLLIGFQIVPLSPGLLSAFSPGLNEIAPAWMSSTDSGVQLGLWNTISVTPGATRVGLAVLISHALLFCVVAARLKNLVDVLWLLRMVATACAFMAAFAILQWLGSNGRLLWFYPAPQRAFGDVVQGSFANKNHFANFVAMGIGPLLLSMYSARQVKIDRRSGPANDTKRQVISTLWMLAFVLSLVAIVFSLSRGAVVALLAGGMVAGIVLLPRLKLRRSTVFGAGGLIACVALAVSLGDIDAVSGRFSDLSTGSIEDLDREGGRRAIWAANLAALGSNPWFGYGVGSHPDVYPAFISRGFPTEFTHAESGYFHTATETGLLGLSLLVGGLLVVGSWCLRGVYRSASSKDLTVWAAIIAGLITSVVHSIVDFVWYIPACMCLVVVLAASALRLFQLSEAGQSKQAIAPTYPQELKLPWFEWGKIGTTAFAGIAAILLLWSPASASLDWDRYLRISMFERNYLTRQLRHHSDDVELVNKRLYTLKQQMIDALEEVVQKNPQHARAHLRLAGRKLQLFELSQQDKMNAIGLVHIRDAAIASRFGSRKETEDWLLTAFPRNSNSLIDAHHTTRMALTCAPLQGDAYGYLADLCFLSPPHQRDIPSLMKQSLLLGPNDGGVLFEAGKQALIAGEHEQWLALWKRAYVQPGKQRLQIATQLATRIPASQFLAEFGPDIRSLGPVCQLYRSKGDPADLEVLAEYTVAIAEELGSSPHGAKASAQAYLLASRIEQQLKRNENAVIFAGRALDLLPTDLTMRQNMAAACMQAEDYKKAIPHIKWCLSRRPDLKSFREWMTVAHQKRVATKPKQQISKKR